MTPRCLPLSFAATIAFSPLFLPQPASAQAALCPAQLNSTVSSIAARSPSAKWGVLAQTQGTGATRKTLVARNATQLFTPASNNKVFTTAAALQKLGSQYRIRTTVTGNANSPNLATLRIIGHGDPTLTTTQLRTLVQQVSRQGVRQVDQLIGDDTYFRGAAINPFWRLEDTQEAYGAPVNSLILNYNATGGSLETLDAAIPNPGNYLVQQFRNLLTAAKITVKQSTLVRSTPAPAGEVELAAIDSPPLSNLLIETNRESNNLFAEALLKTLGRVENPASLNATESGTAAVKAILTSLGVNPNQLAMVDGSGLASRNRTTPEALVQTLQAMAQSPEAQVFRNSLPVAGVNGTLAGRFRNTPAQGRLLAKTGTIGGVVALSGYLTPPNHPPIVLSILVNYSNDSVANIRADVDDVVLALTRLRSC